MEIGIGSVIILAVAALAAGYFIGIFDSRLTQAARKKLEENSKPVDETPKEQNVAGEHTVLKVTVDPAIKWHLELDGARLEDTNATTVEQRQRLVNVVVQMRPWIDGKPAPAVVPVPGAPVPDAQPVPEMPSLKPLTAAMAAQIPTPPPPPPKIDPIRGLRSLLNNEIKTPDKIKSVSIVAMIDDVLQSKLPGTPFSGKGIRLEEGSFGEVIVFVGANRYPSVDAVPDPDIQTLIKSAIADWEKR
jgi:hypothetical protein